MRLKASLDRWPALNKERAQIDDQSAAADRVLEEAEAKHDEVTQPLYDQRREIDEALREASKAESHLVQECENEALKSELEEVGAGLMQLNRDRRELLDQASHLETLIPMILKGLRRSGGDDSLSPNVARNSLYSHARPSNAPFLAQTLGHLTVSRG